jgi:hypothetical protein
MGAAMQDQKRFSGKEIVDFAVHSGVILVLL